MPVEKIYFELTSNCNLHCSMCYRNAWDHKTADMSGDVLEKSLKQIKNMPLVKEVVLGGIGEPTCSQHLEYVIHELKNKKLTLTTNGTSMDLSLIEKTIEYIDHIVVSIDGGHEVYLAIREYPLDKVIENMKELNRLKKERNTKTPLISVQMVLSKTNQNEIKQVFDIAESFGASQVILSNMLPTDLKDSDLILYKLYQNDEMIKLYKDIQLYAFKKGMTVLFSSHQLKTERKCRFITDNALVITSTGEVSPCYRFSHDGTEVVFGRKKDISAHSFGSVLNNTLHEIWNSDEYMNFRSKIYNNHYPSCTDCDMADGCDMVRSTSLDCYNVAPSCADCLWVRNMIYCV